MKQYPVNLNLNLSNWFLYHLYGYNCMMMRHLKFQKCVNYVTYFKNCVMFDRKKQLKFVKWKYIYKKSDNTMNTTELKGDWEEKKSKLKQKFAQLTDSDLLFAEGKRDEMLGRLEVKLGKTKEDIFKIISDL